MNKVTFQCPISATIKHNRIFNLDWQIATGRLELNLTSPSGLTKKAYIPTMFYPYGTYPYTYGTNGEYSYMNDVYLGICYKAPQCISATPDVLNYVENESLNKIDTMFSEGVTKKYAYIITKIIDYCLFHINDKENISNFKNWVTHRVEVKNDLEIIEVKNIPPIVLTSYEMKIFAYLEQETKRYEHYTPKL